MSIGVNISAEAPDKAHVNEVTKAIEQVLSAGKAYHHDQETVRYALSVLTKLTNIEGTTISNCTIGNH